jgi:hypothetical protein
MKKKSKSNVRLLPVFLILLPTLILSQQYDETDDDGLEDESDDCAFISGQHCDQKGICKYCAMCLQSSCILSKTITNNGVLSSNNNVVCNTTQFGTTNLYNWYDYCLSSGNDNAGSKFL